VKAYSSGPEIQPFDIEHTNCLRITLGKHVFCSSSHILPACVSLNRLLLPKKGGQVARNALDALLKNQVALRSPPILIAAAEDLGEEPFIDIDLASEDLLIYRVLASA